MADTKTEHERALKKLPPEVRQQAARELRAALHELYHEGRALTDGDAGGAPEAFAGDTARLVAHHGWRQRVVTTLQAYGRYDAAETFEGELHQHSDTLGDVLEEHLKQLSGVRV